MTSLNVISLSFLVFLSAATAAAPSDPDVPHQGPLLDSLRPANQSGQKTDAAIRGTDIRVNADMTLVPVTVTDEYGRNVVGLNKENFRVYDNTEQRPIAAFSRDDAPVSVGLIFDASRSMRDKIATERDAAARLFHELNPQDEAFLVTVSNRAALRHDFTSDLTQVSDALAFTGADGSTSLLDGIYLGLQQMKKAHSARKALIIVSDGGDNNSRNTLRQLVEKAVESDTTLYTICLYYNPQSVEEWDGPKLLEDLAAKTGGMPFLVRDLTHFGNSMSTIGVSLHNQYVLGYYPPENAPSGKYRRIKVQLMVPAGTPPMQVYARTGYYTPAK
jgi:Ca-activated chloride channel homolog